MVKVNDLPLNNAALYAIIIVLFPFAGMAAFICRSTEDDQKESLCHRDTRLLLIGGEKMGMKFDRMKDGYIRYQVDDLIGELNCTSARWNAPMRPYRNRCAQLEEQVSRCAQCGFSCRTSA